jgi:hypothetical protein
VTPQESRAPSNAVSDDGVALAQSGTATPETSPKPPSASTPGDYTPEQIAEMINNPLGYLWLLNVQNTTVWYYGEVTEKLHQSRKAQNTLLLQPVLSMQLTPELRLISRPIIPINSFVLPVNYDAIIGRFDPARQLSFDRVTGLGDISWMNYVSTNEGVKPPNIVGAGIGLKMNTATNEALGSGKWSAGPAAVAVHMDETWMYGAILQQFWSFAGEANRKNVSITTVQPLLYRTIGKESHVGLMPDWIYNWDTRRWVQLGLGLGFDTMVNLGPVPAQVGFDFYYNVHRQELLGPQWMLRFFLTPVVPAPAWAGRPLFGR